MAKSKKKSSKKRKPNQNNRPPQQNERAAVQTQQTIEREKPMKQPPSDKPLYLRIIMLTIAAVMILGIVVSAVAGATGIYGY